MLFYFSLSGDHLILTVRTHSCPTRRSSDLRCALADAHAHGDQGEPTVSTFEFFNCGHHQSCPTHSKRVPERDCATIRIDVLGIVGKAERTHHGECLGGEGFIDFDEIEISNLHSRPIEKPGYCWYGEIGRAHV